MRKGYILRLYPYFDIDLLVMAQDPSTKFSHICKEALKAYVRGNEYSIKRIKPSADIGRGLIAEKHRLDVCIKFDSYKDKDILDFLDNVKKGYKNMFIKNLVRCYMGGIDLTIFVRGENKYEVLLEESSQIYVFMLLMKRVSKRTIHLMFLQNAFLNRMIIFQKRTNNLPLLNRNRKKKRYR